MEVTSSQHIATAADSVVYDRKSELKAFDNSKTGVKGLVDAGLVKIPRMFIHEQHMLYKHSCGDEHKFNIPIIDLQGIDEGENGRRKVIDQVQYAWEKWGFFQMINHGIPVNVLDEYVHFTRVTPRPRNASTPVTTKGRCCIIQILIFI